MAGSDHDGGAVATPRESSSMSIGDLWPEIDSSSGADYEGAFTTATRNHLEVWTSCPLSGHRGIEEKRYKIERERCNRRHRVMTGYGTIVRYEKRLWWELGKR
jgi:hypothetical protein